MLALLSAAPRAGHTFAAATITRLLTAVIAGGGVFRVCAELAAPGVAPTERAQVIKLLVSLPDRVANMNAGVVEGAETLVRDGWLLAHSLILSFVPHPAPAPRRPPPTTRRPPPRAASYTLLAVAR